MKRNKVPPRGNTREPPRGNAREPPRGDTRETPRGKTRRTPRGNTKETKKPKRRRRREKEQMDCEDEFDCFRGQYCATPENVCMEELNLEFGDECERNGGNFHKISLKKNYNVAPPFNIVYHLYTNILLQYCGSILAMSFSRDFSHFQVPVLLAFFKSRDILGL